MNATHVLSASTFDMLAAVLLHFVWQGAVLGLLTWVVLRRLTAAGPRVRYAVGLCGLMLMAVAPAATWIVIAASKSTSQAPISAEAFVASSVRSGIGSDVAPAAGPNAPDWQIWLIAGWALGVTLMAARLLVGWIAVQRLKRSGVAAADELREITARLAQRLGLRRIPRLAVSRNVAEAMVVGLLRPMVLLPAAWLAELPPGVLEAVVAHELAHVRRLDPWVNALQRIVETLLFYHPAVWWLSRRVRREREFCCDELAVEITGRPLVYAQTLELVAHRKLQRPIPVFASGIGDRTMTLLERVRRVLGRNNDDRPRSLLTPLLAAAAILLSVAVYRAAVVTPQPLLADDELREREVDRERDRDREERRDRDERRRRRSEDDRAERDAEERGESESRDRDDDDAEEREEVRRYELRLRQIEGDLPPEVAELIEALRAEIEELRARLRDGDMEIEIEFDDFDRDGNLDPFIVERRFRGEGEGRFREEDDRERHEVHERRAREHREHDEEHVEEHRERHDEHVERRERERAEREHAARDRHVQREREEIEEAERREREEFERDHPDASHDEREHAERDRDAWERAREEWERAEEPEEEYHRQRLQVELNELRDQVHDLTQLVEELHEVVRQGRREREEAQLHEDERRHQEAERQAREAEQRAREDDEALERREQEREDDEAAGEARQEEADFDGLTTIRATGAGRVQLDSRNASGRTGALLEATELQLHSGDRVEAVEAVELDPSTENQ